MEIHFDTCNFNHILKMFVTNVILQVWHVLHDITLWLLNGICTWYNKLRNFVDTVQIKYMEPNKIEVGMNTHRNIILENTKKENFYWSQNRRRCAMKIIVIAISQLQYWINVESLLYWWKLFGFGFSILGFHGGFTPFVRKILGYSLSSEKN